MMIESVVDYVESHDKFFMVILTGCIFITGCASLFITIYLAWENRLLRKAGTEPDVIAYILPERYNIQVIQLHITNIGRGPAFDIEIKMDGDGKSAAKSGVMLPFSTTRPPITALPQDETIVVFFGVGHEILKNPSPEPVRGVISFKNGKDKHFNRHFCLDARQYEGFRWIINSPDKDTAEALKKIEETLRFWGTGFNRLHTISCGPDEWKRWDEERFENIRTEINNEEGETKK